MKMSLIIPVMDRCNELKHIFAQLYYSCSTEIELVIIDNSVNPNEQGLWKNFIDKYIHPKRMVYVDNHGNIGMVKTLQKAYKKSSGDILAYFHNDVLIYEYGWDARLMKDFENNPEWGLASFFGCTGVLANGGRPATSYTSMLEAELHGVRIDTPYKYIAVLDGFSMILRRKMLDACGGFDSRYVLHHFYDRDISLESIYHGYKNVSYNVLCHHISGQTANNSGYQDWINKKMGNNTGDKQTHDENMARFGTKWEGSFPFIVDPNTGKSNKQLIRND